MTHESMATPTTGAVVEIEDVSRAALGDSGLIGFNLDSPSAGATGDVYAVVLEGWVLRHDGPPAQIEVRNRLTGTWRIPVDQQRPDIEAAFRGVPRARGSGFAAALTVVGLPRAFELDVAAVFDTGERVPLATIRGRREQFPVGDPGGLRPLVVTTLGRTGSTWLISLLGAHSEIVTYRPFEYEPRVLSYWLELTRALSEPGSYRQGLAGDLAGTHWWVGAPNASAWLLQSLEPEVRRVIGLQTVRALLALAKERVSALYGSVAALQGRGDAVYFAEKSWPNFVPGLAHDLFPGGREIFLVRDFRDMLCSILEYNKKRGYASFGRELVQSDEEFVTHVGRSAEQILFSWRARQEEAFLVRYEDVIGEPHRVMANVFAYLEVDSSPEAVALAIEGAHSTPRHLQEGHRTSVDPASSVGRWRRDLDPELQELCQATFGHFLSEFGYS